MQNLVAVTINLAELSRHKDRVAAVIRASDGKPFATGFSDLQIKDAYDKMHTGRTRLEKDGPYLPSESHIYFERCDQVLNVSSADFNRLIEIDLFLDHEVGKPGATPVRTLRLFQAAVMRREER